MRIACVILSLFFISCGQSASEPEHPIPREKFVELLVGMYRIEGKVTGQALIDDNSQKKFKQEYLTLFSTLGTDSLEVRKNFESYKAQPEELKSIMQEVFSRLGSGN